jgi:hypothetical protein
MLLLLLLVVGVLVLVEFSSFVGPEASFSLLLLLPLPLLPAVLLRSPGRVAVVEVEETTWSAVLLLPLLLQVLLVGEADNIKKVEENGVAKGVEKGAEKVSGSDGDREEIFERVGKAAGVVSMSISS